MVFQPLNDSFFQQPTLSLARALLGKLLVKETELGTVSGWIVETEAYIGPEDRAAHGFGNQRTKRTEVMFGPPGYAYTFVMHTHCLINVVYKEEMAVEIAERISIYYIKEFELLLKELQK